MSDRVIVTRVDALAAVLARLDAAAAPFGWRVIAPTDAAGLEARAQADVAAYRLPRPLVVLVDAGAVSDAAGDGAPSDTAPVDTARMLHRTPVEGAVADDSRRRPAR